MTPVPVPLETVETEWAGATRRALVHAPAAAVPLPLVVMLHGAGATAAIAAEQTKWAEHGERHGFAVAFPEGLTRDPSRAPEFRLNPQAWNDGSDRGHVARAAVDDVGFVTALVDGLAARLRLDPTRVYLTGFSNGAALAFRIAIEVPERVAAIGAVAGHCWLDLIRLRRPVPLAYLVGDRDPLNPLDGGEVRTPWDRFEYHPPVRRSLEPWAYASGCEGEPRERLERGISCFPSASSGMRRIDSRRPRCSGTSSAGITSKPEAARRCSCEAHHRRNPPGHPTLHSDLHSPADEDDMGRKTFLAGVWAGAGAMYLFDPQQGRDRRRRLGAQIDRVRAGLDEGGVIGTVRARLPGAPVTRVRRDDIDGLNGELLRAGESEHGRVKAGTALMGVAGGALALYGLLRKGKAGGAMRTVGTTMFAAGLKELQPLPSGLLRERRRVVEAQGSVEVAASPATAWAFLRAYSNLPICFSHAATVVGLEDGCARWTIDRPAGRPVSWTARVVEEIPGRLLTWRSEPGSPLRQSGTIRLVPTAGGTRVDARIAYGPADDGSDHDITGLLGPDPIGQLDTDLEGLSLLLGAD